jgi:multiple antibiotic resistance protein
MHHGELETFAIALLTIVNPVGSVVIFAGMVQDRPAEEIRAIARTTGIAVAVILLLATWGGEMLLALFAISVPAFETAGGLIILLLGLGMVQGGPEERPSFENRDGGAARRQASIAVVPLAMPLLVGPGALATVIVQTHKVDSLGDEAIISLICLAVALSVWICFRLATPICRALGTAGVSVLTRAMGILLSAIAFGMIATGVKGLLPGLD